MRSLLSFLLLWLLSGTLGARSQELAEAIRSGDMPAARSILGEHASAWEVSYEVELYSEESLHGGTVAAEEASLEALQLLMEFGYDPDFDDGHRRPIEVISAWTGRATPEHLDMLSWLLENTNPTPYDLEDLLTGFVSNRHIEGARLLLEHGLEPNWVKVDEYWGLMDEAQANEDSEMVALLDEHGAFAERPLFAAAGILLLLVFAGLFISITKRLGTTRRGGLIRIAAIVIMIFCGGAFLLGGTLARELTRDMGFASGMLISIGLFKIAPMLGLMRAVHLVKRADQLKAKSAEDVMKGDERSPILYLRSFQNDASYRKRSWWYWLGLWFSPMASAFPRSSHEQELTQRLSKIGPVVAIGDPDEELPKLGAHRLYVEHDRWKDEVIRLLELSQLVVLRIGLTEGILWELKNAIGHVAPTRLVVWIVPGKGENVDQAERLANHLHERSADFFPEQLPLEICRKQFIYFESNWAPQGVDKLNDLLSLRFAKAN